MNTNVFMKFTDVSDGSMKEKNNRDTFLKKNKLDDKKVVLLKQVHGNTIVASGETLSPADGVVSVDKGDVIFILTADCLPILFYDQKKKVTAGLHAGRKGTMLNISGSMVNTLKNTYKCSTKDISVIFGPSIGTCCYEVSESMAREAESMYGEEVVDGRNIDIAQINLIQLLEEGIPRENIILNSTCTACSKDYFSYRKNKTAQRMAGVISIL